MGTIMQDLQNIFGNAQANMAQNNNNNSNSTGQANSIGDMLGGYLNKDNLTKMLGPAALGGLAGALIGGSGKNSTAQKALLLGGGAALGLFAWDRYKKQVADARQEPTPAPTAAAAQQAPAQPASPPNERAKRLIQAMVFAARSDGNMDDNERRAIEQKVQSLSLGQDGERIVHEAMEMPVDPDTLAKEVKNADEALETYVVSRSVINTDKFMERNYLQALAKALNIPENVQQGIESDIEKAASTAG